MEIDDDDDDEDIIDLKINEIQDEITNPPVVRDNVSINVDTNRRITISSVRNNIETRNLIPNSKDVNTNYGRTRIQTRSTLANLIFEVSKKNIQKESISFNDVWNHEDIEERELLWREAIRKEFKDIRNRNVWRTIPR